MPRWPPQAVTHTGRPWAAHNACTQKQTGVDNFVPNAGEQIVERCPSWSKEHDWKSCVGNTTGSSNLPLSARFQFVLVRYSPKSLSWQGIRRNGLSGQEDETPETSTTYRGISRGMLIPCPCAPYRYRRHSCGQAS